jgi:hypothetical protein
MDFLKNIKFCFTIKNNRSGWIGGGYHIIFCNPTHMHQRGKQPIMHDDDERS